MAYRNDMIGRNDALRIARKFCVEGYEGELDEAFDDIAPAPDMVAIIKAAVAQGLRIAWEAPIETVPDAFANSVKMLAELERQLAEAREEGSVMAEKLDAAEAKLRAIK